MSPFDLTDANGPNKETQRTEAPRFRPYSAVQTFFLLRMEHLLRRRLESASLYPPDDWRMKALHRAIYSIFCGCVEQGVGEEARRLFQRLQVPNRQSRPQG